MYYKMARSLRKRVRARSRTRKFRRKRKRKTRSRGGGLSELNACGNTKLGQAIASGEDAADAFPGWKATTGVKKQKIGLSVKGLENSVVVFTPDIGNGPPKPGESMIAWCHMSAFRRGLDWAKIRAPTGTTKMVDLENTTVSLQDIVNGEAEFMVSQNCVEGGSEWKLTTQVGSHLYDFLLYWCEGTGECKRPPKDVCALCTKSCSRRH